MIPGLPQVGGMELLIIVAVILLFFGAKRIPELARSLGQGTREFRKGISEGATEEEPSPEAAAGEGSSPRQEAKEAAHAEQRP